MAGLDRFLDAQQRIWPVPLTELHAGRKQSHWMWYVFPQLAFLGRSSTAKFYGISDLSEAADYLSHPVLGPRLTEVSAATLAHAGANAERLMGHVDAKKLRSSMTLFGAAEAADPVFCEVLKAYYFGQPCPLTLAELGPR